MANPMKRHVCEECGKEFGSRKSLLQHKAVHDSKQFPCPTCGATFTRKSNLERHMKTHTVQEGNGAAKDQPTCDEAALGGTVKTRILTGIGYYDPMKFLHSRYGQVLSILKKTIRGDGAIKWYLALKVKMSRQKGEEKDIVEPYFRGKCEIALKVEDLNTGLQESIKKIYTSFIEFQRQGSNWNVDKVVHLKMHMARYKQ